VTDRGDDVAVVVSELLTNALRHGLPQAGNPAGRSHRPVRLGLVQPGQFVLCAVADPSPRLPEPKDPDYLAESGRGLHVIGGLSDRWGSTVPTEAGKVVWALFSVHLDRQPPDWGWFAGRRPAPSHSAV
jgi:hypothetical protein